MIKSVDPITGKTEYFKNAIFENISTIFAKNRSLNLFGQLKKI